MLNVIEVGAEVDIDDSSLLFNDALGYPVHRLMRCPFRPVSIRPRLEISFEDRLQDELGRPPGPHDRGSPESKERGPFPRPSEFPSSVPAWADTCLSVVHP